MIANEHLALDITEREVLARKAELAERYGELIGPPAIQKILGFRSGVSLRRAFTRKALEIRTFNVPGRHGRYTTPEEIARYLVRVEQTGHA